MGEMPELPEVETIARQLRQALVGTQVSLAEVDASRVVKYPGGRQIEAMMAGQKIMGVERRGKFLGLRLSQGDLLVIHLGMTGHLMVVEPGTRDHKHLHLRLVLADRREVRFDDSRKFGRIALGTWEELTRLGVIPRLGLEPLERRFNLAYLSKTLGGSRQALKTVLLDQGRIAGLGNIYVDESCWRARVYPGRSASSLTVEEVKRLYRAIRVVLRLAIAQGGSSIDDYFDAWGAKGRMQEQLTVFGQEGTRCKRCGRLIQKTVVGGRGTHFCPFCQPIKVG